MHFQVYVIFRWPIFIIHPKLNQDLQTPPVIYKILSHFILYRTKQYGLILDKAIKKIKIISTYMFNLIILS